MSDGYRIASDDLCAGGVCGICSGAVVAGSGTAHEGVPR
jgi:hypothetical protein